MSNYRVAFYTRISIGEQTKGYSLAGQESILKTWSKEKGWKWVKTYSEEASAKDLNRERLQEMIQDAKNGLFDGICVIDNDRLSRSTKDLLNVMDDLLKHQVKIHIHNLQHLDIYSQQGRFTLTNFAAFSEFFRRQLAVKIRTGVKQKMKTEWFGQAPFGYKIISDIDGNRKKNTRLIKNPEEQDILKTMKKLREDGKSYAEIAEYLNINGHKTRHTKKDKKSDWYSSTVRNILNRKEVLIDNKKEEI
jgi:DNA invertase Pin-like site-specific DNA recombinase